MLRCLLSHRQTNLFVSLNIAHCSKHPSIYWKPFPQHLCGRNIQTQTALSKMSRVPFEVCDIPMTGFPLGQKLHLALESAHSLASLKADFLVLAVPSPVEPAGEEPKQADVKTPKALASVPSFVDSIIKGELSGLVRRREFTGGEGKTVTVRLPASLPFEEAGLIGLGSCSAEQATILDGYDIKKGTSRCLTPYGALKLGKPLASLVASVKAKSVVLYVESSTVAPQSLQVLIESFLLASSTDDRFKSQPGDASLLESLTVIVEEAAAPYAAALKNAKAIAAGVQLAKELTAAPPNVCNPETLAKAAVATAEKFGIKHVVLGEEACTKRKMGAYLAVNQGSIYQPQFIHLTYTPPGEVKKRIAFIGKGICMDTGGYNLKTQGGIETMKVDMGGAAAVIGAAQIVGSLKPNNVEVHFVVAAAENMIDSKAYRPGDIVTASNGKTIEIGNTDAEGRLTLSDALIYVENEIKPDAIVDCATLTGAAVIALGNNVAAVYGTDTEWVSTILAGARTSGSPLWPMPLFSDYKKHNDSKIADIRNVASVKAGGSITAALFLKEFVKETPWAHIDLAGPVYESSSGECTGYGARLLSQIVMDMSH